MTKFLLSLIFVTSSLFASISDAITLKECQTYKGMTIEQLNKEIKNSIASSNYDEAPYINLVINAQQYDKASNTLDKVLLLSKLLIKSVDLKKSNKKDDSLDSALAKEILQFNKELQSQGLISNKDIETVFIGVYKKNPSVELYIGSHNKGVIEFKTQQFVSMADLENKHPLFSKKESKTDEVKKVNFPLKEKIIINNTSLVYALNQQEDLRKEPTSHKSAFVQKINKNTKVIAIKDEFGNKILANGYLRICMLSDQDKKTVFWIKQKSLTLFQGDKNGKKYNNR